MNDETKKSLIDVGSVEWLRIRSEIAQELRKVDPLSIKRYDYDNGDGNWRFPGHVERPEGDWVNYEDHVRIVEYLKKQIDKAYQDGKANGGPEYSWRL